METEERMDLDVEPICRWQLGSSADFQIVGPGLISQSGLWTFKWLLKSAKSHCWLGVLYMWQKYIVRMGDIQGGSYRESRSFLPVIIERMMGSRWHLLQKHCLFMLVICLSNLPQLQQASFRERVTKLQASTNGAFYMNHPVYGCST